VTGSDYSRLGDDASDLVEWIGNQAFMKIEEGHCIALRIDPASPTPFACNVYDRRPEICRSLERGSPQCLGELSTKGHLVALRTRNAKHAT
jgi:uncharacterized protein